MSNKFCRLIIILFGVCLISEFSIGQIDTAAISAKLNHPGVRSAEKNLACVIYKSGKLVYKKENPDYTLKTSLPVGTISQLLTTALVLTFVQEGKLSLDDKVSTYLPIFIKYSKKYITIRNCLTHETGIQSDANLANLFQRSKFKTLEDEANAFASKKEIETNPGTECKYNNIGYRLAGRVLEIISKKSFDRLMMERLLRPLGMRGSSFTNDDFNAAIDPSLGARSTANDLSNFLNMLLNKGVFNNKQILTEKSIELLMKQTVAPEKIKNAPKIVQGLGYGMGAWILDTDAKENATSIAATSFSGSWIMVDLCRNYSFVLISKELSTSPDKQFYLSIKDIITQSLPSTCN